MLVTNTRGPLLCERGATFLPVVWQELSNPADFLKQPKVKAGLDPNRWKNGSAATVIQPMDFDGHLRMVPALGRHSSAQKNIAVLGRCFAIEV